MESEKKRFGQKLRFFRKKWNFTQQSLKELSRVSQAEISRIETGHYEDITTETITALAEAFRVAPDEFVSGTEFATLFGQRVTLPSEPLYSGTPYTLYFASALTGLKKKQFREIQNLDEQVHKICQEVLYRPRLKTAPQTNPDISAPDVYAIDRQIVSASDVVILAAIFPSLGAGIEVQLAIRDVPH